MRKRELRVNLLRIKNSGVRDFPAVRRETAEKAGLIPPFAGPAPGVHPEQQLVARAVQADFPDFLGMPGALAFADHLAF
jgi:hypothetical protein